jgi:hypothetical protein
MICSNTLIRPTIHGQRSNEIYKDIVHMFDGIWPTLQGQRSRFTMHTVHIFSRSLNIYTLLRHICRHHNQVRILHFKFYLRMCSMTFNALNMSVTYLTSNLVWPMTQGQRSETTHFTDTAHCDNSSPGRLTPSMCLPHLNFNLSPSTSNLVWPTTKGQRSKFCEWFQFLFCCRGRFPPVVFWVIVKILCIASVRHFGDDRRLQT